MDKRTAFAGVNCKALAFAPEVVIDTGVEVGDSSSSYFGRSRLSWGNSEAHGAKVRLEVAFWYWDSRDVASNPWDSDCVGQGNEKEGCK